MFWNLFILGLWALDMFRVSVFVVWRQKNVLEVILPVLFRRSYCRQH